MRTQSVSWTARIARQRIATESHPVHRKIELPDGAAVSPDQRGSGLRRLLRFDLLMCAAVVIVLAIVGTIRTQADSAPRLTKLPMAASAGGKSMGSPLPFTAYPPVNAGPGKWHKFAPDEVSSHEFGVEITGGVITGVATEIPGEPADVLGTRYVVGDIDATDITRGLWRHLDLELIKPDGSLAELNVLRPLWWLEEAEAVVGAEIDLAMYEVGVEGVATAMHIGPCDADSREADPNSNIVIGKIKHHNAVVWDLTFDHQANKPLGVTANHPIFSHDRNDWVPAGEFKLDERVTTKDGTSKLTLKQLRPGLHTVYNVEIHRSHEYLVSQFGILAHNTGIGCGLVRKYDGQIHHIAADGNTFTPEFEKLFGKAGLSLQSPWNRMRLDGHVGPHGAFYSEQVLERLSSAVVGKSGSAYRKALIGP